MLKSFEIFVIRDSRCRDRWIGGLLDLVALSRPLAAPGILTDPRFVSVFLFLFFIYGSQLTITRLIYKQAAAADFTWLGLLSS